MQLSGSGLAILGLGYYCDLVLIARRRQLTVALDILWEEFQKGPNHEVVSLVQVNWKILLTPNRLKGIGPEFWLRGDFQRYS